MIKVDRSKGPFPASLKDAVSLKTGELAKVRALYKGGKKPKGGYNFTAYSQDDVKKAIEDLFHHKCAYCECHHGAGAPPDIEHFRPKGRIKDDTSHTGYWWLAMVWENLLYSCVDCNRERRQVIVTAGMTHEEVEKQREKARRAKAGKADAFPIRGTRAIAEDCVFAGEDALLIDPTSPTRDPADHIVFVPDANGRVLAVAKATEDGPDPYGQASIQVFGLNRSVLVDARSFAWCQLEVHGTLVKSHLSDSASAADPTARQRSLDYAMASWKAIEAATKSDRPFSAVASAYMAKLDADIGH